MKISEFFDKDIARRINPAVVVSEMDEYFVNQEIDEYVFTQAVTKNIYKFLNAIANKKEGKTGVWISGYYGSGKSHFIKYLFYCLNNKYSDKAFHNFFESVNNLDPLEEPSIGMATNLQKKLNTLSIDEIIFNIDAVSDNNGEKDRITRVMLNQLNAFRGYNDTNIALALYLEKPLDNKGVFQEFKDKIKSTFNENWDGNQIRFTRMYLDKVIEIAQSFDSDMDKESLKSIILNRDQDYTIEFFIKELTHFLADKDQNYRLIFLMDEVSQYIGDKKDLLLNLQTIVEEVGAKIGTRVWITCTAQQELQSLVDNTGNTTNEFGKILGRFETMISLESQDAAFITKKRVLDKNATGLGILNDYYKQHKGEIENQFVFDHDLYENFKNREDFTLTYPFIPYQFRLISDVFESFSQVGYVGEGVKNTERAILGITHFTANLCKDTEVGFFVPFDMFFNEQLEKNLTHHARGILDRAYNIDQVKTDEFSRRVVNALFMISNLGESQSVNLPADVENISLLLMNAVDTAKLEMQRKVQAVLEVLATKNIIQVSEGKYRFLKEDEIEVAHLIKSTPVTNEDRLTYIHEDIIQKIIKLNPNFSFGNRSFKIAFKIDDKEIGSKGDFNLKFSIYDNSEIENLAHETPSKDLVIGIFDWLKSDNDLKTQILDYVRTQKYIRLNSSSATGSRIDTLSNFRETNKSLLNEIKIRFEKKFLLTAIISNNQVIKPEELNGSNSNSRFEDMIKRHMESVYRKHYLSNGYATSNADLITNAKSKQKEINTALTPAEEEVNNKLSILGDSPVVGDVVKMFDKDPWGWKDIATLDILLRLAKNSIRRFEWKNEEIDLLVYVDKALNARERDSITIHKEKAHSQEEINSFIHLVNNEIFVETLIPSVSSDFKNVVETFRKKLEPKLTSLNTLKEEYENYAFASHLKNYHKLLGEIYNTRNPEQLIEIVNYRKQDIKLYRDSFMYVDEFIEHNFKSYELIVQFANQNKNNFSSLDDTLIVQSEDLLNYLKNDHEPWDKFPQMKKIFKDLNDAIKARINSLKSEVVALYESIFNEIDELHKKLQIDDANLTTNSDNFLKKINKEDQIAQLEIFLLKANDFRKDNFKILQDYKAKQLAKKSGKDYVSSVEISIAAEMSPTTIETPEQLDAFLVKLRERLMLKLAKNKKIFLN